MSIQSITFCNEMLRALLSGDKTQTRRIMKPMSARYGGAYTGWVLPESRIDCPYGKPGDLVYVKEAWRTTKRYDKLRPGDIRPSRFMRGLDGDAMIIYEIDRRSHQFLRPETIDMELDLGRYRHARFMPKWASRITLRLTDVKPQRVQDISRQDIIDEGIRPLGCGRNTPEGIENLRQEFARAWDKINGKGSWDSNPWVWAMRFQVYDANVDYLRRNFALRA